MSENDIEYHQCLKFETLEQHFVSWCPFYPHLQDPRLQPDSATSAFKTQLYSKHMG